MYLLNKDSLRRLGGAQSLSSENKPAPQLMWPSHFRFIGMHFSWYLSEGSPSGEHDQNELSFVLHAIKFLQTKTVIMSCGRCQLLSLWLTLFIGGDENNKSQRLQVFLYVAAGFPEPDVQLTARIEECCSVWTLWDKGIDEVG